MNRNIILVFGVVVGILTVLLFLRSNLDRSFQDTFPIRSAPTYGPVGKVSIPEVFEKVTVRIF